MASRTANKYGAQGQGPSLVAAVRVLCVCPDLQIHVMVIHLDHRLRHRSFALHALDSFNFKSTRKVRRSVVGRLTSVTAVVSRGADVCLYESNLVRPWKLG